MKKKITVGAAIAGVAISGASASDLVQFNHGKVSESRMLLAMGDEMSCGKEMKEKVKECKKMMKEAKCGSKMEECKKILKEKCMEMSCGSMMKTKEKAKEMSCAQCGAVK